MAFTPVELTKDGKTRIAENATSEAVLRFDGWVPTGTPVTVPMFDDRVRDLIEKSDSVTRAALKSAVVSTVEGGALVEPTGQWDFEQAPKVNGVVLGKDGGGGAKYVSLDGSDSNDGTSWAAAKRTVKAAVLALPTVTSGAESFRAGTVMIGPGEFLEDGDIPANREIRLVGANAKSDNVGTRITLKPGANKHVFAYTSDWAAADGYAHGLVYENLTISGNVSAQGSATVATGGVTAAATTLPLAAAGSLPTTGTFDVLVDDEIIGVTAGAGSTSLTVVRGKYGSIAATHAAAAVVRYAGSAIVMRGGGFNAQLVNVHCRDAGGPAVRLDHSAVDLHCFNFNASACGGPAFAYLPSATSSGSMISFLGGQIDDCGTDALYFEGQSGAGVVNISAMKFESRVSTTKHKHCIASRPHSVNGSGMVFNVDGVIAYALGGNREAVVYNYNGTSQGAAWNLSNVVGRDGYLLGFKSDRYPVSSPSHTIGVLHAGNFDTGAELAQMQLGSSLLINGPWNATPNGVVTAPRGALYFYTGGTSGPVLWIKETGTGNTGWVSSSPNLVASVKTANYTLVAADAGTIIEVNSATPVTITVPNNVLPTGSRVQVVQVGAGQVTLAQSGSMVLRTSTALTTRAQYAVLEIRARSATEAVVDAPATITELGAAPVRPGINFFVASQTLFSWMEGRHFQAENDAPIVVTVPLNASQALPSGYQVDIGQGNVGDVTFAPETAGVTLQSRGGARKLNGRYAIATLRKIDTNVWWLFGDITA